MNSETKPRSTARFQRGFNRGAFRGPRAAAYCDVSYSMWKRLVASGLTPKPTKLNGTNVWPRLELDAWLAAGAPPRAEWELRKKSR